mgnify:CR=1 FL=1
MAARHCSRVILIPEGLVLIAGFHPASLIMDSLARNRHFDPMIFDAFQRLLAAWGDAASLATKRRVAEVLRKMRMRRGVKM